MVGFLILLPDADDAAIKFACWKSFVAPFFG